MKLPTLVSDLQQRAHRVQETVTPVVRRSATAVRETAKTGALYLWRSLSWVALAQLALAVAVGRSLDIEWTWLGLFLLVATIDGLRRRGRAKAALEAPLAHNHRWTRLVRAGITYIVVVMALIAIAVASRIEAPERQLQVAVGSAVAIVVLALFFWRTSEAAFQMVAVVAGLALGPALVAWVLVSVVHAGVTWQRWRSVERHYAVLDARHAGELARRRREWPTLPPDRRVAVALSGGGYRAALTQAGALWALETAGVPVHVLSTVSGGSIMGGAYSLGWRPEEFVEAICDHPPGLPMTMLNLAPVAAQLFLPRWNTGDTYALHFHKIFFQQHRLGSTGPPTLILNTTRYERGARAAFWPTLVPQLHLARGVAASGAFPAAFDPVDIASELYMDGGVVENLGIDGLWIYLRHTNERPPALLVLVDVSADPSLARANRKPSQVKTLLHAQNISYRALHARIFDVYTEGAYSVLVEESLKNARPISERLHVVPTSRVWPFRRAVVPDERAELLRVAVVRPTAAEERFVFAGTVQKRLVGVAAISTLHELTPVEATDAVWFGAAAIGRRLPEICALLGIPCPTVPLARTPACKAIQRPDVRAARP